MTPRPPVAARSGRFSRWASTHTYSRPGRRAAIVTVVCTSLIGASLGATLHPPPTDRFRAESSVIIPRGSHVSVHFVADLAEQSARFALAKEIADSPDSVESLRNRTTVRPNPNGLVTIATTGGTPSEATAIANALADDTAFTAERTQPPLGAGPKLIVGDFEGGIGAWKAPSQFNLPPRRVQSSSSISRFNRFSLRVNCPGESGCGPSSLIPFPFNRGVSYTVTAWLRSRDGARLSLLLGASPKDYAASPATKVGSSWIRVGVIWTPRRDERLAEVDVQTVGTVPVVYYVDGVSMRRSDRAGLVRPTKRPSQFEHVLFSHHHVVFASTARPTGVESGATLPWGVAGLGAGLFVGLVAFGFGLVASLRNEQGQTD